MSENLTIKQEKFVLKYFECGNASEAYRFAYSAKNMKDETINNKSYQLLQKGEIRTRLNELRAKAEEDSKWNVDKLIKAHTRIYEIGIGDVASSHIVSEGAGEGISNTLEVEMRDTNLASAKSALVEIGKLLGYYTAKAEVSGELNLSDFTKRLYDERKQK